MKSGSSRPTNPLIYKIVVSIFITILILSIFSTWIKNKDRSNPTYPIRSLFDAEIKNNIDQYKKAFYYQPEISPTHPDGGFGILSLDIENIEISEV